MFFLLWTGLDFDPFVGHLKFSLQNGGLLFKGGGNETLEVLYRCKALSRVARTMFVFWGNIFGEATNKLCFVGFFFFLVGFFVFVFFCLLFLPFLSFPVAEGLAVPVATLCIVLDGC